MEKAKQAVGSFLSHDGKHKTTVDEDIRPQITEEQIRPHQHENVTTAVDKDIHQDHHHTTVQPLKAKEVLPEQHTHNVLPTEHKTFKHGNEQELRDTLARDAAKYKDTSVTHGTTHSNSGTAVSGEHIHHHVHEHVQPVVQKEVIAPHVVHTTAPVHETHHAEAVHHGTSVLPTKTVEEFKKAGGVLSGHEAKTLRSQDGCPPTYNKDLQTERLDGDRNLHIGHDHSTHGGALGTGATTGSGMTSGLDSRDQSSRLGGDKSYNSSTGNTDYTHSGSRSGATNASAAPGIGASHATPRAMGGSSTTSGQDNLTHSGSNTTQTGTKPSLMQKLNPLKDADGDGKKGFMD